jgi:hypothetical protein
VSFSTKSLSRESLKVLNGPQTVWQVWLLPDMHASGVFDGRDILRQLKERKGLTADQQESLDSIEAHLRKNSVRCLRIYADGRQRLWGSGEVHRVFSESFSSVKRGEISRLPSKAVSLLAARFAGSDRTEAQSRTSQACRAGSLAVDHGEKTNAHPRNRLTISPAVICCAGCPPMFSSSDLFSRGAQALSLNEFTGEKS